MKVPKDQLVDYEGGYLSFHDVYSILQHYPDSKNEVMQSPANGIDHGSDH